MSETLKRFLSTTLPPATKNDLVVIPTTISLAADMGWVPSAVAPGTKELGFQTFNTFRALQQ